MVTVVIQKNLDEISKTNMQTPDETNEKEKHLDDSN
jgi:hypothetical protein